MTVRVNAAVDTGVTLRFTYVPDVSSSKCSLGAFLSRAAALDNCTPLVWVSADIIQCLLVGFLTVLLSVFTLVGSVTQLAKTGQAVVFRGISEKFGMVLDRLASPATLLFCHLKPLSGLSVLGSVGVPDFLTAKFTTGGVSIWMSSVFMEICDGLEDITSSAGFHGSPPFASPLFLIGQAGTESRFSVRQPSPVMII